MLDLDDIVWAATTYRNPERSAATTSGNQAYVDILTRQEFLEKLRNSPQDLDIEDVRGILIRFLNRWGCRLRNYDNVTAFRLRNCILNVSPELRTMQSLSILDFDMGDPEVGERLERVFNVFWHCGSGSVIATNFGPTATSKLLHIVNPNLFTMWDETIRLHYWKQDDRIVESGRGYCFFQGEMRRIAEALVEECKARFGAEDPARMISERLEIHPPHALVKFIDEFNWLAYKIGVKRPLDWISPFEKDQIPGR